MRILIATPYLPWPLNTGGNAAQFSTLKCLVEDHQFTLVCPVYDEAGIASAKELQVQLPGVNIRAVFCGSPPPSKANFLTRVARFTVRCGRRLLSSSRPQPAIQSIELNTVYYPSQRLPEKLIVALQAELVKGVDLCQVEFADMLALGAWFPKNVPKLFIHHQIHFIYSKRLLDTYGRNSYTDYLDELWRLQEVAYLQNFQGVITFSEEDRKILLSCLPPEKLHVSPFPIPADVGVARELPPAFDGRFLFVASEEHVPNRDALEWLLAGMWPEILRQLPAARLVVIGKWSESARTRLAAPGVIFSGFVDDLSATLRGGIMLVPLRIGSGIRVKIMVAMAQGVPVVTTSIGCEGMLVKDGEELLVRDGVGEFAEAAVQLAQNQELWKQLATAGRSVVLKHYSPEGVRRCRNEIYAALTQ